MTKHTSELFTAYENAMGKIAELQLQRGALLAALRRLVDTDPSNSEVYEADINFARAAIANINTTGA